MGETNAAPFCPHCQGKTLVHAVIHLGRQRYRCKDCGRSSYGRPAFTTPPPPPCIQCGERTRRGGPTAKGTPTYRCTTCHRRFIPPLPPTPKILPNGRRAKCHHCSSDDLVFNGIQSGKQRYKCRACQKATYGIKPKPIPPRPCPYCRAQCRAKGRDERKRPRYFCTTCNRQNTNLFPEPPRGKNGPYRWRRSFCLDIAATSAITDYCNHHVLTMSQAIRAILHDAADKEYATPTLGVRLRTAGGNVRYALESTPAREAPRHLPRRLPDLRPEIARRRMTRDPRLRHKPLYYITCQVTVALDDKAYTGLLRTMDHLGLNHQQAARHLITETARPKQTPIALPRPPA